ncbi:MAG: Foldase protein PrsA [Microgenomates bacterium OLB22]|nr:MAG: Foldase protein PrsA [Microgenomates bacterium OLB22]
MDKKSTPKKTTKKIAPKKHDKVAVAEELYIPDEVDEDPMLSGAAAPMVTEPAGGVLRNPAFYLLLVIVGLCALVYSQKHLVLAAMVNGKPIWRYTVIKELEHQGGKFILDEQVTSTLLDAYAKEKKVDVSDKDVKAEYDKIGKQLSENGQTIDQFLSFQGMTKDQLMIQIKRQLMLKKLVAGSVKVTDEDVEQYKKDNKDQLPKDLDAEALDTQVRQQIESEKISAEVQKLLSTLREKADVKYFITY